MKLTLKTTAFKMWCYIIITVKFKIENRQFANIINSNKKKLYFKINI